MPNTSVEIFLKKLLKSESEIKQKKKLRTIYSQPINLDIKPLKNSFNKSKKKLDNAANNLTEVHQKSKNQRQSKKLSAIQRKSFRKVSKNDFKDVKYKDFLGLNKLHGQYLESTLQKYVPSPKNSSLTTLQLQNIQQEFLKLDLHGCKIKIVRSKCNNLIGLEGIIIMESKFNFRHREVRKGGNRTYKFLRKFDTGKWPTKQNGLKNGFPEELGLLALTILIVNA